VSETSDPVRWDVDGLSIVDPRQVAHLIELVDALRDYGFHQDLFEAAFIPFRIEKDLGGGKVRLKRVKESIFESDEKLFALPDILDEENGPYADLLDHLTRCRVKMLNDLFNFESKLTVDEVEDEIREEQNTHFIEGKAVHTFSELCAILDFMPDGIDSDEEHPVEGRRGGGGRPAHPRRRGGGEAQERRVAQVGRGQRRREGGRQGGRREEGRGRQGRRRPRTTRREKPRRKSRGKR
jgi:hypothetical protein